MRFLLYTDDPGVMDLELLGLGVHFLRLRVSKDSFELSVFGLLVSGRFKPTTRADDIYQLDLEDLEVDSPSRVAIP